MHRLVRQVFVVAMALAFAMSGTPWRACLAAQPAPSAIVASHLEHDAADHHAHHSDYQMNDGDHDGAVNGATQEFHPADADAQCCSMCTVASAMPAFGDSLLQLIVSPHRFSWKAEHCSGRSIRVDPGIPKRVV